MKTELPILAIETSGELCSVALYFNESKYVETSLKIGRSHSRLILSVIKKLLSLADADIKTLRYIAVSIGPGSFTGLRIGLAAAKGLAFGADCRVVPVPTFDAMGLQISKLLREGEMFHLVNKVNAKELYTAKFQKIENNIKFVTGVGVVSQSEFKSAPEERVFGNIDLPGIAVEKIVFSPSAITIASLSLKAEEEGKLVDQDLLEPFYVKDFNVIIR